MDEGYEWNNGPSWRACSIETGCCVTLRTERNPNVRISGAIVLKDEDVRGELGEGYGEEGDGEYVNEESEDDERLEFEEDEEADVEMKDVGGVGEEEELYCEDYLTLLRNLVPEKTKTKPEIFYPIDVDPGDSLETSLWEREKGNYEADESGQEMRLVGVEHIAGPCCLDERGYKGHNISAEEMKGCTTYQCLAYRGPDWSPEPDDQEWEREGGYFLTGVGDRFPSRDIAFPNVYPPRHGWDEGEADTYSWNVSLLCFLAYSHFSSLLFSDGIDRAGEMRETSHCPSTPTASTYSPVFPSNASENSTSTA
jgi:hypothetical protein